MKYENCNKCRMELGIVGGNNVSQIKGNLVDLENDLRGQTRAASLCPDKHYHPNCPGEVGDNCQPKSITIPGNACEQGRNINTELVHLPPCQMLRFPPVPLPGAQNYDSCPAPKMSNPKPCNQ